MKSKKVLVIAHFFYPCNVIAAHRPKSWAQELSKAGYDVTVLTRQWDGSEKNWEQYLADNLSPESTSSYENFTVHALPYRRTFLHRLAGSWLFRKVKILRFGLEILSSLVGAIDFDRNMYSNYHKAAQRLFKKEQFDLIIATSGPYTSLKLSAALSAEFHVPWFADFRDVWNMDLLKTDQSNLSWKNKVRTIRHKHFIGKWLRSASEVILCSEGFTEIFTEICPGRTFLFVKNGYEKDLYAGVSPHKSDKFTILCLGTLYLEQDRSALYEGVRMFLAAHPDAAFCVRFLGVNVNPLVSEEIRKNIDNKFVETTDFVGRGQALAETLGAQVLYYPVWNGYKGVYSGKIFEYLGAKRPVLITPGDGFVLDALLNETGAGKSTDTGESCFAYLQELYLSWKATGEVPYSGNSQVIGQYTRENQAALVINAVKKHLK